MRVYKDKHSPFSPKGRGRVTISCITIFARGCLALIRSASLLRFAFPLAAVAVFDGTQVRLCELFFFLVLYQSSRLRGREKIDIVVLSSPSVSYGFNGPSCYSPVLNSGHVAGFVQLISLLYTRYFLTRFVEHEALRFFRDFGFESASSFLSLYLRSQWFKSRLTLIQDY